MQGLTDIFLLSNGYSIPCVGFGTFQSPDGETTIHAIHDAIKTGYRHIDCAAAYGNEISVGKGIKASRIERKEIFITSKVFNTQRGYETTLAAFEKSLQDLQLDFLDLYLIHWPAVSRQFKDWIKINSETWRAMEELYDAGRIRAIGVSNFLPHHLEPLIKSAKIIPMVNQIEFHPGQMQQVTVDFCKENNILVEAWSPLGQGKMLTNSKLSAIADKYRKSVAQLCIKWALQNGVLPLPKSVTKSRIVENTRVFDFNISEEDMNAINEMPYCGGSGLNPDDVDF
jgi:diketogulonate reductase-like aldo/keto reductase